MTNLLHASVEYLFGFLFKTFVFDVVVAVAIGLLIFAVVRGIDLVKR